jgi:hypothetical protein
MTNFSRLIWFSLPCQRRLRAVTHPPPPASGDGVILKGKNDERGGGATKSNLRGQRCLLLRPIFSLFIFLFPIFLIFRGEKDLAVADHRQENRLTGVNLSQENRPAWKGLIEQNMKKEPSDKFTSVLQQTSTSVLCSREQRNVILVPQSN